MASGSDWGSAVSWLLVILGWIIINTQHNRRETRKEIRAALNNFYELLNEIEDDAITYHTSSGDPVLSRRIKRRLSQLYRRVNLAFQDTIECQCASQITAFRRAVTLHNFDTATYTQLKASDPVFEEITATKERLVNVLEQAFMTKYR